MSIIIDKRQSGKNPEAGNRKRFLDRCKDGLRDLVEKAVDNGKIKDIGKKDTKVRDADLGDALDEPSFSNNRNTGAPKRVFTNNRKYRAGDRVPVPSGGSGGGNKATDEVGSFSYTLSKKEFLEILFEDMALPNYIKESLVTGAKYRLKRGGTGPDGPITRLNLLKTLITGIGRKFASRAKLEAEDPPRKPAFITDEDLRYNIYTKRPLFIKHAVVFAMIDYSGSMGDHERKLAKRFILLLYLFLEQEYEEVTMRFIIHDTEAHEVTEKQFFSVEGGGGTKVTSGFQLIKKIIDEEYDLTRHNIYVAQVSDGDDFEGEEVVCGFLKNHILPSVQYFAYLQVSSRGNGPWGYRGGENSGLIGFYKRSLVGVFKHVGVGFATQINEVFPALANLFKKGRGE